MFDNFEFNLTADSFADQQSLEQDWGFYDPDNHAYDASETGYNDSVSFMGSDSGSVSSGDHTLGGHYPHLTGDSLGLDAMEQTWGFCGHANLPSTLDLHVSEANGIPTGTHGMDWEMPGQTPESSFDGASGHGSPLSPDRCASGTDGFHFTGAGSPANQLEAFKDPEVFKEMQAFKDGSPMGYVGLDSHTVSFGSEDNQSCQHAFGEQAISADQSEHLEEHGNGTIDRSQPSFEGNKYSDSEIASLKSKAERAEHTMKCSERKLESLDRQVSLVNTKHGKESGEYDHVLKLRNKARDTYNYDYEQYEKLVKLYNDAVRSRQ